MKRSAIAVAAAAIVLFLACGAALATDLLCTAASSGQTWHNVLVPAGATCQLDNTRVTGKIEVQAGARLLITTNSGDTTVAGDISGSGCDEIDLESTGLTGHIVVGGNLSIQNCSHGQARGSTFCNPGPIPPQSVLIGGNIKCNNNDDGCVFDYCIVSGNLDCSGNSQGCELEFNAVGKTASLNNNVDIGVIASGNAIGGDLKCNGNSPGATGGSNTVAGNKLGQCSGL